MKRKLFVLFLALCMLFLASCDFSEPLESLSNMIHDAAVNAGNQFLKETTLTSSSSEEVESSEPPSESSESSESSEEAPSESDTTTETEVVEPPEPDPLPIRENASFDAMMGTNVDFVLPNNASDPAKGAIFNLLKTDHYFSFVRIYKDFEEGIYTDGNGVTYKINEGLALTNASLRYKSQASLFLNLKFDKYVEEATVVTSSVTTEHIEALSQAFVSSSKLTLKDAIASFATATTADEFTSAQNALDEAFTTVKGTYGSLTGNDLRVALSDISAESALALGTLDEESPFFEAFDAFDLALTAIISDTEATDDALKESVDTLLDTFKGGLGVKLTEYKTFVLAGQEEQKVSYLDLAKLIYEYEKRYEDRYVGNLRLIELGRHPEKSLSTQDYAKLISTVYDGGENNLSTDVGIVNVNADAKIVFGALEKPNVTYVAQVMQALKVLRPNSQPLFVGAFNTEAFAPSDKTPESVYLADDSELSLMAEYRDELYSHVGLYVAGFGYNTLDTESEYYASEQLQADYLVRSMLIFSRLGIDRASICTLQDKTGDEYNGFGILREDNTAKISHYYLSATKALLSGYTFSSVVENAQGAAIYEFTNADGAKILAVWNAVGDDSTIADVKVNVGEAGGTLYTLGVDSISATESALTMDAENGWALVTATKTPQFISIPAPVQE